MLVLSCKKEITSSNNNVVTPSDTVSFKNTIYPLVVNNCSNADCHPGMEVYDNLLAKPRPLVVPFDTANSGLYQSVYTKRMPQNVKKLSDSEIKLICDWILQGAKNN
jgi:uncharacterized membrane protein